MAALAGAALVMGSMSAMSVEWEAGKGPITMPTVPSSIPGRVIPPGTPPGGNIKGANLQSYQDGLLEFPAPTGADAKYAAINGHKVHEYVTAFTNFARKYRDNGHPQFWGRLIGSQADTDSAKYTLEKFKSFNLTDAHIQPFDLVPQWYPQGWTVTATGSDGAIVNLETAQPAYQTPDTKGQNLTAEAAWVGTGSEADYVGRDVRGKIVFIYSTPWPGSWRQQATAEDALRRAEAKGAAGIVSVIALPGNVRMALYPTSTNVPTFSMGLIDGYKVRDLIGAGKAPKVTINMAVKMEEGMKTSMVWGTLPGVTDEKVIIIAHRDGWYESGTDNASGAGALIGLAEYFSKVPKAQRKRTIVFISTTGHHNGGNVGGTYILQHRDKLFDKGALFINLEHVATGQTYELGEDIRFGNRSTSMLWYAGGPRRPKLQDIAVKAFHEMGVSIYESPENAAPGGEMSGIWPYIAGVQASDYNMFFHSDHETAETVPWTGLQEISRAYAKIIDETGKLPLSDLQRPDEPPGGVPAPIAKD